MTREEAIEFLLRFRKDRNGELREVINMAIEALSEETSTIQKKHQLSEETPTNIPTNTPTEVRKKERGMTIKLTREEAIQDLKAIKSFERYARGRLALDIAIEALKRELSEDGTLEVKVEDATKVGRVLITDDEHRGGLYYPDEYEPKGEDLISRAEAIEALRYAQHRFTVADEAGGMGSVKWSEDVIYFAAAERVLTELPSTDRPRGEWINKDSSVLGITYECSNCGRDCVRAVSYDIKGNEWKYNFCPNCGADMRATERSEE